MRIMIEGVFTYERPINWKESHEISMGKHRQ